MKNKLILFVIVFLAVPCCAQEEVSSRKEPVYMTLEDENKIISNALQVYKDKSKESFEETTVLIEDSSGSKTLIVSEAPENSDSSLVFSPDGGRAFYMDTSSDGSDVVYGINFATSQTYSFGGASSFSLADCPNKENYVVVTKDGEEDGSYYIYDLEGNSIDTITFAGSIDDISEVICY